MKPRYQFLKVPFFALAFLLLTSLACSLPGAAPVSPSSSPQDAPATLPPAPIQEVSTEAPVADCFNPYYPVAQGDTWEYEVSGSATDTFTRSILSASGSEFTDQDVFGSGTTRTGQWKCESGNLIALTPGGSASVDTAGQTFNFTITSNSGITFPANLEVGNAWSQDIAYEGTQDAGGTQITSQNQATTSCTATGRESVTVPAGTFDALKVECNSRISISISGGSPIVIEAPSVAWYAEGVGMVKTVSSGSGFDSTIVLKSYQIP